MKPRNASMVCALVILCAAGVAAQNWEKKDWKTWSLSDCEKILNDSPWAKKQVPQIQAQTAQFSTRNSDGSGNSTRGVGDESKLEIDYIIQLRSALPVRQAIVRESMIQNKYDSLSPQQKVSFDQQINDFATKSPQDVVIVHVLYNSNVPQYNLSLKKVWQAYPDGVVPQNAYLDLPNGKKVEPLRFISPKSGTQEFELIFPRVVDGEPIISKDTKVMWIEFPVPAIAQLPADRVHLEFKTDKMAVNGSVTF